MSNVSDAATCPDCRTPKRIVWLSCRRCNGTGLTYIDFGLGPKPAPCPLCGSAKEFGYTSAKGRGGYWGVRCDCALQPPRTGS